LHYLLDVWVEEWRRRQARGDVIITRYADDFVVGFQHHAEAVRFQEELHERLRGFRLELYPEKDATDRVRTVRCSKERRTKTSGSQRPANFLGFTHISAKSREGKFLLVRQTMRERMRAKPREVKANLAAGGICPSQRGGGGYGRWYAATSRTTPSRPT
jgi:hypothetical protein